MYKQQQPNSGIHDTSAHYPRVPSFNLLVREKSDEKFCLKIWEKEKWIKEQISSSSLILVYTIHLPTIHMCTKFQSSRPHSSWEKCDENF